MKPRRVVHFYPKAFGSAVVGLPWQLAELVATIENVHPGLRWYVADAQTIGPFPLSHREPRATLAGDSDALIRAIARVEQFESGVFAGVPGELDHPAFRSGGLWTEDEEKADLGDAIVEIRAFDTSCWSVGTNDAEILSSVVRRFSEAG